MVNVLPNFVHRSNYSYYYLFTEVEVIRNKIFSKNLKEFSNSIGGEVITFELLIPPETRKFVEKDIVSIPNSEPISLDTFYEMCINHNNNLLYYYFFDFFITDKLKTWEIFCSSTLELAIAGCDKDINNTFLEYFRPYEEVSAKMKLNEIGEIFRNEDIKNNFMDTLCSHYNF